MEVGNVSLLLELDLSKAQAQLEAFRKQLMGMNLNISPEFTKPIEKSFAKINKTELAPKVSSKGFQDLNKEVDNSINKYNKLLQKTNQTATSKKFTPQNKEVLSVSSYPATDVKSLESLADNELDDLLAKMELLNTTVITPVVDHTPLDELNAHLDLKKKHWDDLNDHFSKNPLKPKIDDGGMAMSLKKVETQNNQVKKQIDLTKTSLNSLEKQPLGITGNVGGNVKTQTETINLEKNVASQQVTAVNGFKDAVGSFSKSTEEFKKANKRTLMGSLFRGVAGFIGMSLGQLLVAKLGSLFVKTASGLAGSAVEGKGNFASRTLAQGIVKGSAYKMAYETVPIKDIQALLVGTLAVGTGLESVSAQLAKQEGQTGEFFGKTADQLNKMNTILFDTFTEITVADLIVSNLKMIKQAIVKGLGMGLTRIVASAFQSVVTAPAKMLAGAFAKTGADQASVTTTAFKQALDRLLTGQSNTAKREDSVRKGFITAGLFKGLMRLPGEAIKMPFQTLMKGIQKVFPAQANQPPNMFVKAWQNISGKVGRQMEGVGQFFAQIKDVVNLTEKGMLDMAQDILGVTLDQVKEEIAKDEAISTEDILKQILAELKDIKSALSGASIGVGGVNTISSNLGEQNIEISVPEPITAQELSKAILPLIDRLRRQGGRVGESPKAGGIVAMSADLPNLNLETKGKRVDDLKAELKDIVTAMGEANDIKQLEDIADYLVRNWEKVSKQDHKNYAPDIGGGMASERLNFADNTQDIQQNWDATGDEIVAELNRLVTISRQAGYQVQRNISEGSPGITKWIRHHWRKTVVFIARAIRSLEPFTKDIGSKIAKNFEEVGKRIGGIFEQGKEAVSKFNLGSAFENVKGKVAGVVSSAKEKVSQSSLPTVSLPEFEMPSIKLPDIDLGNIFGEFKNKLNEVVDKLKGEFDKLSQINIQDLTGDVVKNINDLWINLSKTIDSQKAIIIEKAKVNYKKVYDKAVNHLMGGLASAIISIETIQSKLPEVNIPAITLPSLDFKASFEGIKQKISEQVDSNKAKLKQLFNIDYSGLKTSYIASIKKTWQSLLNTIKEQIPIIEAKAKESYTKIYNKAINNIVGGIGSAIIATSSIQPPQIDFSFDPLVNFFDGVKSKIEENENVITTIAKVNNSIASITRLIRVKFTEIIKAINTGINDISRKIQEKISSIDVDEIKDNAEVGIQNLANNLKEVLHQTNTLVFAQSVNDGIQSLIGSLITLFEGLKEKASNIPNVITFAPVISAIDSINENIDNAVKGLNKLAKITDFSGQIKALESTIKSLRFKLLFNSVKALKKITKFLDFEVNLDDGWKKNIVKFLTRGLYQVTKTTLRELGIALGQIMSYVAKDLSALFKTIYNSEQFLSIKEDIESFVGQLQDVFQLARTQFERITGFFNRGNKKQETETVIDEKGKVTTNPKEEIYFQKLAKTIAKTLIENTNRRGAMAVQSALGLEYSPKRSGEDTLGVLIDKIEFDPTALKDIIKVLEDNWEDFTIDGGQDSPFANLADEMDDIEKKWKHTGNYFNQVLKRMEGQSKTTSYTILHALAEGSPGLTQDIRNRWLETTRHVGRQMQGMAGEGESAFQRIIDVANGLKITGVEAGSSLYENIKGKLGNLTDDLIEKGEIKVYELMGININDIDQVDTLVNKIKDKFDKLNDIEKNDIDSVLNRFTGTLNRRDNLAFRQVRGQIKNLGDLRKDIQQRLANPPSFVDKNGKLDKRAILKYLSEVEGKIRQYQVGLGNLTQTMEVNPNIQKVLEQLPLEARREFNSMFSSITNGFENVESIANDFKSAMLDILNLDSEALRNLGVPESFIEQIDKLAEKGELAREALDFSNFELPTVENTTAQAERALANIYVNESRVQDIQSSQQTMRGQRTGLIGDIKQTKSQFDRDYRRLIQQGKTVEAKALKDAYQEYLKSKAQQLKEIKQVEARYAEELGKMAISLGDFETEGQVKAFIGGFATFTEGVEALAQRVSEGNAELKNEVIGIANTVNDAVEAYQKASKEIVSLENKLAGIEGKKAGINQKYDRLKQQARERNNLQLLVRLEQQRVAELNQVEQEQRQLNQQLEQQKQITQDSRRTAFEQTRGTNIATINAVYETETATVEEEQLTLMDRFKAILKEIPGLTSQAFGVIMASYDNLKQRLPILQRMEDAMKGMGLRVAGLAVGVVVGFNLIGKAISAGVQTAVNKIQEISSASFNAALELESLQSQFKFVFGEGQGLNKLSAFREQTDRLGLSFKKMTGQFVQFTMGLQGANLESASLEMFGGIQEGLRVRGASPEVADRALTALTQMANKGKVSLEELTGQLGEALPGALAVAADAMGVSTSELIKMVEQGRLLSEDFLPKFTAALSREASGSMADALETGQAKLANLENSITMLQEVMGKGTLDIAKPLIEGLDNLLRVLLEYGSEAVSGMTAVALQLLVPWKAVFKGMHRIASDVFIDMGQIWQNNSMKIQAGLNQIKAGQLSLQSVGAKAMASLQMGFAMLNKAIGAVLTSLAPMILIFAGLELARGFLEFNKEAEQRAKKLRLEYEKILATLLEIEKQRNKEKGEQNKPANQRAEENREALAKSRDSMDTGNFLMGFYDYSVRIIKEEIAKVSGQNYADIDLNLGGKADTFGESEYLAKVVSNANATQSIFNSIDAMRAELNNAGGLSSFEEQRAKIEKEIEANAATINGLMASTSVESRDLAKELKQVNLERQKELEALRKTYFPTGDWETFTGMIQGQIDFLNQEIEKTGDPDGYIKRQVEQLNQELKQLEFEANNSSDAVKALKDSMGNITRELGNVQAKFSAIKFENDILYSQGKAEILNAQADSGLPSGYQTQSALAQAELQNATRERERLGQEAKAMTEALKNTKDNQTVTSLLTTLKYSYDETIQTLEDVSYEIIEKALNNEGIKDNERKLLEQLKRQQELRQQTAQADEQVAQSRVNVAEQEYQRIQSIIQYRRQLEDLDLQIADYFRQRQRGLEDFATQYQDIAIQNQRQSRDLLEQYQDLGRTLNLQLLQAENQLATLEKDIKRQSLTNQARQSLNFGADGLFSGFINLIDELMVSENEFDAQELTLNEQRLQTEEEVVNIARQVRSLQEQSYDAERQRIQQLRDLMRAQEDWIIQQKASWTAITRQVEDMERQAKEMGIAFTGIAEHLDGINGSYLKIHNAIADMAEQIQNSANNMSVGGTGGSGTPTGNIVTPVAGLNMDSNNQWGASRDGGKRTHWKVDYPMPDGTPVVSPIDGEITKLAYDEKTQDYHIIVKFGDTEIIMGHLRNMTVKLGDMVSAGQQLGTSWDGHLDYGVKDNGQWIHPFKFHSNPEQYLGANYKANANTSSSSSSNTSTNKGNNNQSSTQTNKPDGNGRVSRDLLELNSQNTNVQPTNIGNELRRLNQEKSKTWSEYKKLESQIYTEGNAKKARILFAQMLQAEIKIANLRLQQASELDAKGRKDNALIIKKEVYNNLNNALEKISDNRKGKFSGQFPSELKQIQGIANNLAKTIKEATPPPPSRRGLPLIDGIGKPKNSTQGTIRSAIPTRLNLGSFPQDLELNASLNPIIEPKRIEDQLGQMNFNLPIGLESTGFKDNLNFDTNQGVQVAQTIKLRDLMREIGFPENTISDFIGIFGAESSFNPNALNDAPSKGGLAYGLGQVNMFGDLGPARRAQFGLKSNDELYDIRTNLKAVLAIYREAGNSFRPWVETHGRGTHRKFMNADPTVNLANNTVNGVGSAVSTSGGNFNVPSVTRIDPSEYNKKMAEGRNQLNAIVAGYNPKGISESIEPLTVSLDKGSTTALAQIMTDTAGRIVINSDTVNPILADLKENKLVSEEVMKDLLYFRDTNDYIGMGNYLEQQGIDLASRKDEINQRLRADFEAKREKERLENEKKIVQQGQQLVQSIYQQQEAVRSLNLQMLQFNESIYGYLTASEKAQIVEMERTNQWKNYENQLRNTQFELRKIADFTDNPEQAKEAINKQVQDYLANTDKVNTPEMKQQVMLLAQEVNNGTEPLIKLIELFEELKVDFEQSESIFNDTTQRMAEFTKQTTLLGNAISALQPLVDVFEKIDATVAVGFKKDIALMEIDKQFLEIENALRDQIDSLVRELNDPGTTEDEKIWIEKQLTRAVETTNQLTPELKIKVKAKTELEIDYQQIADQLQAIIENSKKVGERVAKENPFDAVQFNRFAREKELNLKLLNQLKAIDDARTKFQDNQEMLNYLDKLEARVKQLNELDLSRVEQEVNVFAQAIKDPLNNAFKGLFSDFIRGTKTLKDLFLDFANSVADFFANLASQLASQWIMDKLFGGGADKEKTESKFSFIKLAGGLTSLLSGAVAPSSGFLDSSSYSFASGITLPTFSTGGKVNDVDVYSIGGVANNIKSFSRGGNIIESASLGLSVMKAMKKEGSNAVPIVAHLGERLLSAKTGDAQIFAQMEKDGIWDEYKRNRFNPEVKSFNAGGIVGNGIKQFTRNYNNTNRTQNQNTIINVNTPDALSFRKSRSQIAQEEKLAQKRMERFK